MNSDDTLKKVTEFLEKNINPCSKIIAESVRRLNYKNITLISRFESSYDADFDFHVAENIPRNEIHPSPHSDYELLEWLKDNEMLLLARDFALDYPVNQNIEDGDFEVTASELFYRVEHDDELSHLKLSLAKSWIFAGLLFNYDTTFHEPEYCRGIVVGVHKLDSYLVIN